MKMLIFFSLPSFTVFKDKKVASLQRESNEEDTNVIHVWDPKSLTTIQSLIEPNDESADERVNQIIFAPNVNSSNYLSQSFSI